LDDLQDFLDELCADLIEHQALVSELDGTARGLRDRAGLEAAVARPFQTGAGGHSLFLGPAEKAAAIADSIIRHQPFVDGNKRVAAMAAGRMLDRYGLDLIAHPVEFAEMILWLDQGTVTLDDFADWLDDHCLPLPPEEEVEVAR
jgi:death-on-curing protein